MAATYILHILLSTFFGFSAEGYICRCPACTSVACICPFYHRHDMGYDQGAYREGASGFTSRNIPKNTSKDLLKTSLFAPRIAGGTATSNYIY